MITLANLGKSFGDQTLFEKVSLQLNPGQRYGLVGANGSGKTTLLNIIAGDQEASEGSVAVPQKLRLGVLRQNQFLYEDEKIINVALMGNEALWKVMVEKEAVLAQAETDFNADRFSELEELVQRYDGYTAEARAAAILEGLGLPTEIHYDPLSTLSGGFKLRVLLAQVLAGGPDVLLLDEPTNHLDILSIRWLETFLRDFSGPAVVISHDHRFLDNISTSILDVDYNTVMLYKGDYSAFVRGKQAERDRREKDIAGRQREIAHHQKFVDRFRAKATKARQAQSKLRMIEKKAEEMEELPHSSRRYPTFRFDQGRDSGRDVLTVAGVKKAFNDNEVLPGVDLLVERGDRLAIMGPNGIGKSTLLKIIMGELEADEGEVEWGYETHPGYFAQDHQELFDNSTAEGWIGQFCPGEGIGFVRGQLGLTLFSGDEAKKNLGALSGGEAARLVFTKLVIEKPNVLVLDEPTNHLDLESIESLVRGLKNYPGTIILVSHDRWLVGQIATRVVEIKPDEIRDYHGTYDEYVHFCGDDHLDVDRVVLKARGGKGKKGGKKASGATNGRSRHRADKQRQEASQRQESLLAELETAEARMGEIDALFCRAGFYDGTPAEEVRELEVERAELERSVGELTAAWEQAEEELGVSG
ncbi:MAG: ATP-binding cassette domain-containing protein [Candidatus Latescibacteria bacterium]|nr:ATP-binding cassette domain-containing protein [Candidatus Latescibacterota bacterium]